MLLKGSFHHQTVPIPVVMAPRREGKGPGMGRGDDVSRGGNPPPPGARLRGHVLPEQEPPLEIWRISAQGLLPAPNGVYSGCKAAGRGGEGLSRSGGDDASTKKAPPPFTHIAMSNGDANTHPLPHSRRLELALGHLYDPIWKGTAAITPVQSQLVTQHYPEPKYGGLLPRFPRIIGGPKSAHSLLI